MTNTEDLPQKMTLAEIRELSGYGSTATTYQMLRLKNVHPVSYRATPGKGPAINEYALQDVLNALGRRIRRYQKSLEDA